MQAAHPARIGSQLAQVIATWCGRIFFSLMAGRAFSPSTFRQIPGGFFLFSHA
jgi:hypothetical protein